MPVKLAATLVAAGQVASEVMEEALRRQVLAGGSIDTVLLEQGAIGEAACLVALGAAAGLPTAPPRLIASADPKAVQVFPAKLAERHGMIPLSQDGRVLHLACSYPADPRILEEISFMVGRDLRPSVGIELRIRQAIAKVYVRALPPRFATLAALVAVKGPQEPSAALDAAEIGDKETLGAALARAAELVPDTSLFANVQPTARPNPFRRPATSPQGSDPLGPPRAPAEPIAPAEMPEVWKVAEPAAPAPPRGEEPAARQPGISIHPSPSLPGGATGWGERSPPEPTAAAPTSPQGPNEFGPQTAPAPPESWKVIEAPPQASPPASEPGSDPVLSGSADAVREALIRAPGRDSVIDLALRFALGTFEYAAAFAIVGGNAVGWDARGTDPDARARAERVQTPLDVASLFKTVYATRGRFFGPAPNDPTTRQILSQLGRPSPETVFLFPVEIRERVVAFLYGDGGRSPVAPRRAADYMVVAQEVGRALERLIVSQKMRLAQAQAVSPSPPGPTEAVPDRGRPSSTPAAPPSGAPPAASPVEQPPTAYAPGPNPFSPARAPAPAPKPAARPLFGLPSMTALFDAVERLIAPDPTARGDALATLLATPEIAAAALVARFPGPIARGRGPVTELPSADELGPIPAAIAKLGQAGARALSPLLTHVDVDTRYYAVLAAGSLPFEILVAPVFQRTLDAHPVVASAARAATAAFAKVPGCSLATELLRGELDSPNSERQALAAKALAALRDLGAVEKIIDLTGSRHGAVANAAAQALSQICRENFGTSPRKWRAWWATYRDRPRGAWLVAALRHADRDVRGAAFEELTRLATETFGYDPDGGRREREAAAARWEAWWASVGSRRTPGV